MKKEKHQMFSFGQIGQLPILFDVDHFLNHLCHEKGCTRGRKLKGDHIISSFETTHIYEANV